MKYIYDIICLPYFYVLLCINGTILTICLSSMVFSYAWNYVAAELVDFLTLFKYRKEVTSLPESVDE